MTTTTGDAETLRRLNEALRAHHGDFAAWKRVGGQLAVQRQLLGYGNRSEFVRRRMVPLGVSETAAAKLAYDIEGGPRWGRKGFTVNALRIAAQAWNVTLESFAAALDGGELIPAPPADGGNLVPLPAAQPAPVPAPAALAPAALMVLSPEMAARAIPYVNDIHHQLSRWKAEYAREHRDVDVDDFPVPSGEDLFGPGTYDAGTWNARKAEMSEDELVSLIATLRALAAPARDRDTSAGLPRG